MSIKCVLLSLIYQFVSRLVNNKNRLSLIIVLLSFISITHANPSTYAYLPNLKNNQQDISIVQKLEEDFKLNQFKKFSGLAHVYYSRYNNKIRLIWAKENNQFILVEVLHEHKYHKSEWIPKLKNTDHHPLGQVISFNSPEQVSASNNAPEVEGEVYYIQNRVIELDNVQQAVLNNPFHLSILVGSAGAGKTTLSLIQLANRANLGNTVLYITKSAKLKEAIHKEISTYDNANNIDIKTYSELFGIEDQRFETGLQYFKAFAHTDKMVGIIKSLTDLSDEVIYTLIQYFSTIDLVQLQQKSDDEKKAITRSVIGGNTCKNINKLNINHVSKILAGYRANQEDLTIKVMDMAQLENPYDFIFVDEAQNFSYAELKNLNNYRLRKQGAQIVYSIDQNQQMGSFGLKTKYIEELQPGLQDNIFRLNTTYRNSKAIVYIANNIIRLKHTITSGDLDAPFSIQQMKSAEGLDNGRVIEIKAEDSLFKSIKENQATAKLAIITDADQKEKASRVFGYDSSYIYTPEEIQGLEFQHIMLFNPIGNNDLYNSVVKYYLTKEASEKTIQGKYQENKNIQKIFHQPVRGSTPAIAHINPLNQLYIAVTRGQSTLLIYQNSVRSLKLKENCAKAFQQDILLDQADTSGDIISLDTMQEEWIDHIKQLLDKGDITRAKTLWDQNVANEKGTFENYFTSQLNKISAQNLENTVRLTDRGNLEEARECWSRYHLESIYGPFNAYFASKSAVINKKWRDCLSGGDLAGIIPLCENISIGSGIIDLVLNENTTALMLAVDKGDTDITKLLIDKGANLNLQNQNGYTALMIATYKGDTNIVKKLIEKDAGINLQDEKGYTALMIAIYKGNVDIATLLIDKEKIKLDLQNNSYTTALMLAADKGNTEIAEKLIEKDANLNLQNNKGYTALIIAVDKGNTGIAKLLIDKEKIKLDFQNNDHVTALMLAAYKRNVEIAKLLIDKGADLNLQDKRGDTALMIAIYTGNTEIAKLLIDEEKIKLDFQNNDYATALMLAADKGNTEIAEKLIEKDANLKYQNQKGDTALNLAIYSKSTNIAEKLIEKDANLNVQNKDGDTALMLTIYNNRTDITELLIDKDANLNLQNKGDYTALMLAINKGNTNIAEKLIKKGANLNLRNKKGNTALGIVKLKLQSSRKGAEKNKYNKIKELLEQHGAIS